MIGTIADQVGVSVTTVAKVFNGPADVAAIGYDNLPMAAWTGPAPTTVDQPLQNNPGTASRMLLDLAHEVDPPMTRIDLVTELLVREGTAAAPEAR
jgi:LacI family transcriptional regulator